MGIELFDCEQDPGQYTNLVDSADHQTTLQEFKDKMTAKLRNVRTNDLEINYSRGKKPKKAAR